MMVCIVSQLSCWTTRNLYLGRLRYHLDSSYKSQHVERASISLPVHFQSSIPYHYGFCNITLGRNEKEQITAMGKCM